MELNVTRAEIRYFPEVSHGIIFDQWASMKPADLRKS
jgi:hypothetical protein